MKQEKQSKAWAISSLVTGILGAGSFLMPYFSLPLSIMGIVFSTKQKESAMAKAGLILGIIGTVFGTITMLVLMIYLSLEGF